jgi:hypothetical protein
MNPFAGFELTTMQLQVACHNHRTEKGSQLAQLILLLLSVLSVYYLSIDDYRKTAIRCLIKPGTMVEMNNGFINSL